MRIKVLGSAAGGGFPQWNCGCLNCSRFRAGSLKGGARTQAQVAISPSAGTWFLLNASPDLRQQLLSDREFAPKGPRGTPIAGIILTSADTDCVLGLLHLREFQPLVIYATDSVRRVITEENSLFRTLERSSPPVDWEPLPLDRPIPVGGRSLSSDIKPTALEGLQPLGGRSAKSGADAGLCCRAVSLESDFPDYVTSDLRRSLLKEEAVIALEISQGDKKFLYAPSLPGLNERSNALLADNSVALLDGTFWTDNELQNVRGEGKTAREIGHMPLSGPDGLLQQFPPRSEGQRRILIHLNNTNPVLDEESAAYRAVREAGWEAAYDGMEITL